MQRRLAAIMSIDVVGYSRLMGEDEAGTLAALTGHREEFINPEIGAHQGRIVKLMGDGALVEFPSVVAAVECAVAIQRGMAERNAEVSEDRRIEFRIGINLGDIIVEGDDIYGDGVNIAARLEALAEPRGICVSATVYELVAGKTDAEFEDLGEHKVKNIAKPVRVWHWRLGEAPARRSPGVVADRPSIAVLPFDNLSGDSEQEYFADGIVEDIITALSKIRWLDVIARNSTFAYKGTSPDVRRVAEELGVRYVIEGSVRRGGNRLRISAQLIDATTGNHVWAERYDRELADIFAVQDEITETIAAAIEPELGTAEGERARRLPPGSLDAWETFQRGLWHTWRFSNDDGIEARRLFRRAIEQDPRFAAAHAYESFVHFREVLLGYADAPDESLGASMAAARRALALDDKDPVAHFALGRVHMLRGEHDASISELETALELNPNFAIAYYGLGMTLSLSNRLEEADEKFEKAMRLSPRDPLMIGFLGFRSLNCTLRRDFEAAADWGRKCLRTPYEVGYFRHAFLASALANLDRMQEARAVLDEALREKPDLTLAYVASTFPTREPDGLAPYLDGLRKAGLPA